MKLPRLLVLTLALGATAAMAAPAQENWDTHCAKCHGADGAGKTVLGKKLKAKDYTDAKSLEGITDEQLEKDILEGIKKNGKTLMKGYQDDLSADDAKALVGMIRKFSQQ